MVDVQRHEIGDHIYLFESPMGGDTCLISAHGGYKKNVESFDVSQIGSDIKLYFYGPHGKSITAKADFLTFKYAVVEEYPRDGLVHDYFLSKYQGRHSGKAETYSSLENQIKLDVERKSGLEQVLGSEDEQPYHRQLYDDVQPCHFVTIRNRFKNMRSVTLKEVVTGVHRFRPQITKFHCSFCRTIITWPWVTHETYTPSR
jgi:hypothetical protein